MKDRIKILFLFIDGLGLGCDDPAVNPFRRGHFPELERLLADARAIDARLETDGLPQSATGQASLLTGINTAQRMGRHIEGFPPPRLKTLIERENLFGKLQALGARCAFANAYWIDDLHQIPPRRQSVTTVMTLAALGRVRGKQELLDGQAVYHDIDRHTLHERGYLGGPIDPKTAAAHLRTIAAKHDFTLFEYFLTDRAGHRRDATHVHHCLATLERFVPAALHFAAAPNHLFLLTSDHGNLEDLSVPTHTTHPVPLIARGAHADAFHTVRSLTDLVPTILQLHGA